MKKSVKKKKSKKRLIIIISIIVLVLGILSFFGYKYYIGHYRYTFKLKNDITVNLNDEVVPKDYVKKIKNATVKYGSVDTSTVGEKELKYTITDKFKKKHNYYLKVTVKDNIAPVISGNNKESVYVDSKIEDYNKYVKVTDNYDKEVKITHSGEVDTSKKGTYEVVYTAEDSSGNKTTHKITFTVKDKPIYEAKTLQNGVIGTSSKGYTIENKNGATYVGGYLVANKTYPLSSSYGSGLTGSTKSAFEEMNAAAALDGYSFRIGSGYRSYNTQKTIYNNYVKRDGQAKADTYSARPGHSEHQSGLAIDICSNHYKEGKYCIGSAFNDTPDAKWLSDNAYKYGFILRYPNGKTNETGYKYESWHFRYVGKELASKLYNGGSWITMEDYFGITSKYE